MKEFNVKLDFSSKMPLTWQLTNTRVRFLPSFINQLDVNLRAIKGNRVLEEKISIVIANHLVLRNPRAIVRVVTFY